MFDECCKKDLRPEVERYSRRQNIAYETLLLVDITPSCLLYITRLRENLKNYVSAFLQRISLTADRPENDIHI